MGDDLRIDPSKPVVRAITTAEAGRRVVSATELFADKHEIEIHHGDAIYRLRLTRAGKLILTK